MNNAQQVGDIFFLLLLAVELYIVAKDPEQSYVVKVAGTLRCCAKL